LYALVVFYGILSLLIGIGVSIGYAIWKFGLKKNLWYSWLLGGLFWTLALILRAIPLLILVSYLRTFEKSKWIIIFTSKLFAGLFETIFRVLLLLTFTKQTADTKEKVIMAGLGWGTVEAILVQTLPILFLITLDQNNEYILYFDGIEYILLIGGFEKLITEIFHLIMMIMVFYGIKYKLKEIEISVPIKDNIFSKDPKPTWIWILIVILLHFMYDFLAIVFLRVSGLIMMYILMTGFMGILLYYTNKRMKAYPLFPGSKRE